MIRTCSLLTLVLGFSLPASAAAPPSGVDRDAMFLAYLGSGALIRGGSVEPHWLADGRRFWYVTETKEGPLVWIVDPRANTKRPLFDTPRLLQALRARLGKKLPAAVTLGDLVFLEAENKVRFNFAGKTWLLDLADNALAETAEPQKKDIPRLIRKAVLTGLPPTMEIASPDGRFFATEKDHNLALRPAGSEEVKLLTIDGREDLTWSTSSAGWSPSGAKLAAFRTDTRGIPRYPLVHWLKPSLDVEKIPLSEPGGKLPRQELFIVDVASRRLTKVMAEPTRDHHFALVRWLPDSSELWFARIDREFKKLELLAADAHAGAVRVVVTETQKTFVQTPLLASYHLPLLAGGKEFLWFSERTGWNHIYRYDSRGRLLKALTAGEFPVVRIMEVDEKAGWVYFTAHGDRRRPYDTHLYRVGLDGGKIHRLTDAEGQHDTPGYIAALLGRAPAGVVFSPSKEFFLDTHSSIDRPVCVELRRADGKRLQVLERANADGLKRLSWRPPEEFVVKAADGRTDLHGVLYKPFDFDPKKKYPVIDYIYNGPQTTWVPRTFNAPGGVFPQAFAQLGFIVFVVDGRGTPERGKAFQDVVHGHFGQNEIPDHVATLKQLAARRPYMDRQRVGLFGGSFGGYMTVRGMLTAPEVYRAAVANAPIYAMEDAPAFIEMYMGSPKHNPQGYKIASCLPLASRLKGKLLIVHGTSDVNAPFAATMRMIAAFVQAGKPVDLVVLPEETHATAGASTLYLIASARRYFQQHLCP
jgi:dipeptidyl aminopeptidase/acylaminoacyl peptidase